MCIRDSEMNRAAAAQRKEGDMDAILAIAEENGIDREIGRASCRERV